MHYKATLLMGSDAPRVWQQQTRSWSVAALAAFMYDQTTQIGQLSLRAHEHSVCLREEVLHISTKCTLESMAWSWR